MRAMHDCFELQDPGMEVAVQQSAMGIVCSNVTSPGHPNSYSSLATPAGNPFQGTPDGCAEPLHGCAVNFTEPAVEAPRSLGTCVIAMRHAGEQVSFTMTGDAAWLREKRPAGELRAAFEAAYPHLPHLWLQEMAEFVHTKASGEDLRVRCVRVPYAIGASNLERV